VAEKKDRSTSDIVSDWWNKGPQAPVPYTINGVPVVNQPADSRTLQRTAPAPYLSLSEGIANIQKNTDTLDFARDLVKGLYKTGKNVITDPIGSYEGAIKAGNTLKGIMAAYNAEQTGKWAKPEKGTIQSLMSPSQLAKWRQEGTANYRKLASHFSYVDKNGERQYDSAALMRNLTQRPMEVFSILNPVARSANRNILKVGDRLGKVGKGVEILGEVADFATNPAPFLINQGVKTVAPVVSAGLRAAGVRPTVFTRSGEYSPKMLKAFDSAGVDPAVFNSPEMRQIFQGVINDRGISPAAIKQAVLEVEGIKATRSMTTGQMPLNAGAEGKARADALQGLSQRAQPPLTATDLSGAAHTFDYNINQWVDANKIPVKAPGKIQILDAASNRKNLPRDVDAAARTETARNIVETPAEIPNSLVPTFFDTVKRYVPSVGVGNIAGYALGEATGFPGMGLIGGAVGGATTGAVRAGLDRMSATRAAQAEVTGAPRAPLFQAPNVRSPVSVAGGIATTAQNDYQTPVAAAPEQKAAPQSALLPGEVTFEQYQKDYGQSAPETGGNAPPMLDGEVSFEDWQKSQAQPQAYGGRTAYKAGGKVNGIEPLVLALMGKAKMAKKTSNKATEPLLNERDDAIANALAVAQKAI
jgi:hypothetical protein